MYTVVTGTTGSISQGVQQPYEISVPTELEEARDISLTFTAYPNPTGGILNLRMEEYLEKELAYWLYRVG